MVVVTSLTSSHQERHLIYIHNTLCLSILLVYNLSHFHCSQKEWLSLQSTIFIFVFKIKTCRSYPFELSNSVTHFLPPPIMLCSIFPL